MKIEVLGMYGGNYAIFELDGEGDPVEVSSDAGLKDHLRNRGLTEQQISKAVLFASKSKWLWLAVSILCLSW